MCAPLNVIEAFSWTCLHQTVVERGFLLLAILHWSSTSFMEVSVFEIPKDLLKMLPVFKILIQFIYLFIHFLVAICRLCVIAGNISPIDVITHVPILCEEADIPYVYVPSKEVSLWQLLCLPWVNTLVHADAVMCIFSSLGYAISNHFLYFFRT